MIYLVDTGILLRAVDRKDAARGDILTAFRVLRGRGDELATTTQNLREFWNVSTRPTTARGGYGRSPERTASWLRILTQILQLFQETPATFGLWAELVERYRVIGAQVHDAHLVAIMQSHGVREMLTLNPNDFRRYPEVRASTPKAVIVAE